MTSAYTPLLGLVLPVTGELSGTWGTVWNDSGTSLIDSAISGTTTLSVDADATLTTTTGAANQARQAIILWTAGGTATRTITVPAQSKIYTVINKTSSTQSIKIVGAGPTTGVTIIAGESAVVAWNGVDFIKISNISGAGVFSSITNTGLTSGRVVYSTTGGLETDSANLTFNGTTLTANTLNLTNQLTTAYGGTGLTSYTAGDLPYYATGTALSKLAIGTAGQVLTVNSGATAPQWTTLTGVAVTTFSAGTTGLTPSTATSGAVTLAGTLATTNGGTGLTSFTANGVVYASSTSALATGTALTFDGSFLGLNRSTAWASEQFGISGSGASQRFIYARSTSAGHYLSFGTNGTAPYIEYGNGAGLIFQDGASEQMRLTSTGLGIGTSSPSEKLEVYGSTVGGVVAKINNANASGYSQIYLTNSGASGRSYVLASGGNSAASGFANNFYIYDTAAAATRLTLDSSGNLGLGVTPSAWLSGYAPVFENRGGTVVAPSTTQLQLFANAYLNSSVQWVRRNAGYAAYYNIGGGAHEWHIAGTSTAGSTISWTQAMTLDASGNLVLGATSAAYRLDVRSGSTATTAGFSSTNTTAYTPTAYNGDKARIFFQGGNATGATSGIEFTAGGNNENYFGTVQEAGGSGAFVWQGYNGSAYAERMRLDSSGNLLVGNTDTTGIGVSIFPTGIVRHNTNGTVFEQFQYASTAVGSITTNGAITVYNTTSDYRLKTVVGAVSDAGSRIDALEPIEYEWKAGGSRTRGFLAHKFQEVYPQSVTGTKDAVDDDGNPVYQAMQASTSEVIADLVAEIQSLRKRLADAGI